MKTLKEKIVVVTGAGSGMGREIALVCATRGAVVALADFNQAAAEETARLVELLGGRSSVHRVDVSMRDDMKRLADEVIARYQVVDVVFNNAGIIPKFEHFEASSYDVMERMLAVNLWGVVYGTKEFLPYLLARPEAALVNTSSAAGLLGYMGMAPYTASKFAVRGFTEALRMEYQGTNLTVSLVHPGAIATPIKANSPFATAEDKKSAEKEFEGQKDDKRLTSAPEAARQIVEGLLKGQTRILIGKDAKLQDLLARFLPKAHTKLFHGFLKGQLK